MITRISYVLLYLTVTAGSALYFSAGTSLYITNNKANWSATLREGAEFGTHMAAKIYRHLTEVGSEDTEGSNSNGAYAPLDDDFKPGAGATANARNNALDGFSPKAGDKPGNKADYFDREGLELLFANAKDFEEELDFVVPKPVRARRPQIANRILPIKPPVEFLRVPRPRLAQRPRITSPRPAHPTRRIPGQTPAIEFSGKTSLVAFKKSPFPYTGTARHSKASFLNVAKDGRRGHRTRSGRVYWADTTYNEKRSLLHVPKGFDVETPGVMVVFFHGWGAKLDRDIWRRQRLPQQITASGANAVLVAPQFAVDARDSSIGNFRRPGALRDYLHEAAQHLANMVGRPDAAHVFMEMPIVLVGYSGGYVPAAYGLAQGGISDRVLGVVLLDALYAQLGTFTKWIKQARHTFFVSSYRSSTRRGNARLKQIMKKNGIPFEDNLSGQLQPGSVKIIHAPTRHRNYVTQAWAPNPVADILRRIPGLPSRKNISQQISSRQVPGFFTSR